jgi:hypothetical protein
MKQPYATVLLGLICSPGLSVDAKAQDLTRVVANVPHEFAARGQTLPAGTYTVVSHISMQGSRILVLSNNENRTSLILLPTTFEGVRPSNRS